MKPKVALDIAILGHGWDMKSTRRGVERQVTRLFAGLTDARFCETFFVATTHLAGAYDFLEAHGVTPEKRLKYFARQLHQSRQARRLQQKINETIDDRDFSARLLRKIRSVGANWLNNGLSDIPESFVSETNIFHQPHLPYPLLPFPRSVQRSARMKKFVTIHDLMVVTHPEFFSRDHRPYVGELVQQLSDDSYVFCGSESVRNDVLELTHAKPERVFIARPAAEPEFFFPVENSETRAEVLKELGLPDIPYFLALSVPELHKNFAHIIRCFGELLEAKQLSDTNLVLVGRNAARSQFVRDALEKLPQLIPRVFMPGFVPDEKLAALYSGATAFLFPSLAEGFGFPPLEAMQCGTPVISSNTTSMPEVVGDAGILLPPTDVDAWCQAMLKVCCDTHLRSELAAKSIARATLFSWDRFMDATIAGYRASLAET